MVFLFGTGRKASYKLLRWLPAKTQTPSIPLAEYTAANIPLPTHSDKLAAVTHVLVAIDA
jgi:hypothetical protein